MKTYVIAFMASPMPSFLPRMKEIASEPGSPLRGAILDHGPGCTNLGVLVDGDDAENFVTQLTMALMPARYSYINDDPRLTEGTFADMRTSS